MAPIVSPKLLSQIMMHGCTAELHKASYVKVLYADLKSRPVAVCKPTIIILGSVPSRPRKELAPCSSKVSYTCLPNSTFIIDPENSYSKPCIASEEISPASVPAAASVTTTDSGDEELERLEQEAPVIVESINSLGACPAVIPMITHLLNVPSTAPSASSFTSSCEPPSTAVISIPTSETLNPLRDTLPESGAPPVVDRGRNCSPVDSLDIVRLRRASEATREISLNGLTRRAHKYNDARGLRGLRLRGLEILKKIKW